MELILKHANALMNDLDVLCDQDSVALNVPNVWRSKWYKSCLAVSLFGSSAGGKWVKL